LQLLTFAVCLLLQVFSGHSGPVTAGTFTPDGKLVVSAGGENDCSLRVWNPKTGECTLTMHGALFHEDGITCLDVHHDGSVVITGGQDGAVRVTNIHNSRMVASLAGESVGLLAFYCLVLTHCCGALLLVTDDRKTHTPGTCTHTALFCNCEQLQHAWLQVTGLTSHEVLCTTVQFHSPPPSRREKVCCDFYMSHTNGV
jgi:WD40 repeat protein